MIATRRGIALSIVCAAAPAVLLLGASPAAAKHGVKSIEVGPIWNNMDAQNKCPKAAAREGGAWTGDWRTTRPGMSECDIKFEHGSHVSGSYNGWHGDKKRDVEAGPIFNQMDAERKCPEVARKEGGTWTGQWRTTRPGMMSVCEIKR